MNDTLDAPFVQIQMNAPFLPPRNTRRVSDDISMNAVLICGLEFLFRRFLKKGFLECNVLLHCYLFLLGDGISINAVGVFFG